MCLHRDGQLVRQLPGQWGAVPGLPVDASAADVEGAVALPSCDGCERGAEADSPCEAARCAEGGACVARYPPRSQPESCCCCSALLLCLLYLHI